MPPLLLFLAFLSRYHQKIVNMSSNKVNTDSEKPTSASEEVEAHPSSTGGPVYDEKIDVDYNRSGAIDAETIEFNMTVLEAVKAYPSASWWAFVMSCTIVSYCKPMIATP